MKFYIKEHKKKDNIRYKQVFYHDVNYRFVSQVAHPNMLGSINFYLKHKEKDKKSFNFSQYKEEERAIGFTIDFLHEMGKFFEFHQDILMQIKSLFKDKDISDHDWQIIHKKYKVHKEK